MRIKNAVLHTMEGIDYENGWLTAENGVITGLGPMGVCPEKPGEAWLDLDGAHVYPGFIDAHTHLGMWEDGLGFEGDDGNEETDPLTPQLRAIDALNPMDHCFQEALEAGVTTVVTGPGSANPIGGQMAAVKTYGRCIDKMIVKAPLAIKMALGENPKTVYHGKHQAPVTRMATAALIREQLYKAERYLDDLEKSRAEDEFDPPEYDARCEALLPLLRGEIQAHIHCHRADDIFTAIRIGEEFNLDYVIVHGTEGHLITEELAEKKARVLSGPILCDRSKPELRNLTPACPGKLAAAGVQTAIITDHPVIPLQYLPLCAGLAAREGMEPAAALRAITIEPARICGIDNRVGSLAVGKDADCVVFRADPLTLAAKPEWVFVAGREIGKEE